MALTVPVDLVTAAHRRLLAHPVFLELVADGYVGTDLPDTDPVLMRATQAWVYQGLDSEGRPFRDPEGSGKSVIVLQEWTDWAGANAHNTAHFPMLQVLVYTDSLRDESGAEIALTAPRACKHVSKRLRSVFHLPSHSPGRGDQNWSTLSVHSSIQSGGLTIREVPGTQAKTVRGEMRFNTITD